MPLQQIDKPVSYINTETQQYPITEAQIREIFPNVSFPVPFVPPNNFAPVFPVPQPSYDPVVQVAAEGKPVLTEKGHYEQTWVITDKFTDYRDENGVLHTKEEQEADAIAQDLKSKTPATVTMRQARLALLDLDLLSSIDEAINAMPEPDKTKAKIEWEYAAVVERNSDWVSDLGQQLGLSDTQIDDLFRLAATK